MARLVRIEGKCPAKDGEKKSRVMVGVAQLVELRVVIPAVVGSIPIVHPNTQ